jgi:hypothetical protein
VQRSQGGLCMLDVVLPAGRAVLSCRYVLSVL